MFHYSIRTVFQATESGDYGERGFGEESGGVIVEIVEKLYVKSRDFLVTHSALL